MWLVLNLTDYSNKMLIKHHGYSLITVVLCGQKASNENKGHLGMYLTHPFGHTEQKKIQKW